MDEYGSAAAFLINAEKEFERNRERYAFLRWGQPVSMLIPQVVGFCARGEPRLRTWASPTRCCSTRGWSVASPMTGRRSVVVLQGHLDMVTEKNDYDVEPRPDGPSELLFTVDEESGLTGVADLDACRVGDAGGYHP